MMDDSQPCPDSHRILRLSLTKQKRKKAFIKSKKDVKKELGCSRRNWFEDMTLSSLPGKKRTKDVLCSPVSQEDMTFSVTPDNLKSCYELTPGSSAPLSVGHILQSQSWTPSPCLGWSPPFLGLSPITSDKDFDLTATTPDRQLMRSLGVSPNDSGLSWTSSLATPSLIPADGNPGRRNIDSPSYPDQSKGISRVLFSPSPKQIEEGRLNDSVIEMEVSSRDLEGNDKEQIVNLAVKYIKPEVDDRNSMPFHSQDIKSEYTLTPIRNDNDFNISEICVKTEIKEESVSDVLSDFFDPPAKCVGRRRCAPSCGKKRKSTETFVDENDFSNIYSTPKESSVKTKSILSSEKKRSSQTRKSKRVRFNEEEAQVKVFDRSLEEKVLENVNVDESFDAALKSDSKEESCDLKTEEDLRSTVFSTTVESSLRNENLECLEVKEELPIAVDNADDMFSQVSPTALREMCSVASVNSEDEARSPSPILSGRKKPITENTSFNRIIDKNDVKCTYSEIDSNIETESKLKDSTSDIEEEALITMSSVETHFKKSIDNLQTESLGNKLSSKSKVKKFLYPTSKQIKMQCPNKVLELPNKIETKSESCVNSDSTVAKTSILSGVVTNNTEDVLVAKISIIPDSITIHADKLNDYASKKETIENPVPKCRVVAQRHGLGFQKFSSMLNNQCLSDAESCQGSTVQKNKTHESEIHADVTLKADDCKEETNILRKSDKETAILQEDKSNGKFVSECELVQEKKDDESKENKLIDHSKSVLLSKSCSETLEKAMNGLSESDMHTAECIKNDEDIDKGNSCTDKRIRIANVCFTENQIDSGFPKFVGFQTAAGRNITLSNASLEKSEKFLNDIQNEDVIKIAKNDNVSEQEHFIGSVKMNKQNNGASVSYLHPHSTNSDEFVEEEGYSRDLLSDIFEEFEDHVQNDEKNYTCVEVQKTSHFNSNSWKIQDKSDNSSTSKNKSASDKKNNGKDMFSDIFEDPTVAEKVVEMPLRFQSASENKAKVECLNDFENRRITKSGTMVNTSVKKSQDIFSDIFNECGKPRCDDLSIKEGKGNIVGFKSANGLDLKCTMKEENSAVIRDGLSETKNSLSNPGKRKLNIFSDIFEEYGLLSISNSETQLKQEEFTGFKTASGHDMKLHFTHEQKDDLDGHNLQVLSKSEKSRGIGGKKRKKGNIFSDIFEEFGTSSDELYVNKLTETLGGFKTAAGKDLLCQFNESPFNEKHLEETSKNDEKCIKTLSISKRKEKGTGGGIFSDIFEEYGMPIGDHGETSNTLQFVGFKSATGNDLKHGFIHVRGTEIKEHKDSNYSLKDHIHLVPKQNESFCKRNDAFKLPCALPSRGNSEMKSSTLAAKFSGVSQLPKGFRPFKPPKINRLKVNKISHADVKTKVEMKDQSHKSVETTHSDTVTESKEIGLDISLTDDMFMDEMEPSQNFSPDSGRPIKKAKLDDDLVDANDCSKEVKIEGENKVRTTEKDFKESVEVPCSSEELPARCLRKDTNVYNGRTTDLDREDISLLLKTDNMNGDSPNQKGKLESYDSEFGEEFYSVNEINMLEDCFIETSEGQGEYGVQKRDQKDEIDETEMKKKEHQEFGNMKDLKEYTDDASLEKIVSANQCTTKDKFSLSMESEKKAEKGANDDSTSKTENPSNEMALHGNNKNLGFGFTNTDEMHAVSQESMEIVKQILDTCDGSNEMVDVIKGKTNTVHINSDHMVLNELVKPFSQSSQNIEMCRETIDVGNTMSHSSSEMSASCLGIVSNSSVKNPSEKSLSSSVNSLKVTENTLNGCDTNLQSNTAVQKPINISASSASLVLKTPESDDYENNSSLSHSACGKSVNASSLSSPIAVKTLEKQGKCSLFQSASGKSINASSNSFAIARKTLENENTCSPFQSASGKSINVSANSLALARKTFESEDICSPFQSASRKCINVTANSLAIARKTLESENTCSPFQSASGKSINVSANSLALARKTLESENTCSPFQSASGKSINVSANSLAIARKTLESENTCSPFQSASGKSINVSANSLALARKTFESEDTCSPFQSASGKCINVTANSLAIARKTLESENTCSPFQSASGKSINVSANSLAIARKTLESENTCSPFQSASGKSLDVSADSLAIARKTLESEDTCSPFQSASGKCINVLANSFAIARKTLESKNTCSPFQSASGKSVDVSANSLAIARKTLESENTCSPFQSASGKSVDVSANSLAIARKTLESENTCSPFQSASGKSINVSANSLANARKTLENQETSLPFQSAIGNTIVMSKNAQNAARTSLKENDRTVSTFALGKIRKLNDFTARNKATESHQETVEISVKNVPAENSVKSIKDLNTSMEDNFADFLVPDDFDVEMESPPQKQEKTRDDHRLGMKPLILGPEDFLLDRKVGNISKKPYSSRSLHEKSQRKLEAPFQVNSSVASEKTSFVTPYKSSSSSVEPPLNLNSSIKMVTPVFGIKQTKMESSNEIPNNIGTQLGTEALDVQRETNQGKNHNYITVVNVKDSTTYRNVKNIPDFKSMLEKARKVQEGQIEAKKRSKVRAVEGQLYKMKHQGRRIRLRDVIEHTKTMQDNKIIIPRITVAVTSGSAVRYKFKFSDFYTHNIASVYVGDGALLVPNDEGYIGEAELFRAFLVTGGVDPGLFNREWFTNHYRWIVWKLAAYERHFPSSFGGRALTPENVMLQMKYRYDREIDKCNRSALKKITEKDDAPSKRLVLAVANVSYHGNDTIKSAIDDKNEAVSKVLLELTDGWYGIPATVDGPLTQLIEQEKIAVGQKIVTSGAEIMGLQDASPPLEIPNGTYLKISANSTRPAAWDCRLGYHCDPRPLCVPLCTLYGDGGHIGCVDVVLVRRYPIMYMEKMSNGSCVFRSAQAEEKHQRQHQQTQQEKMEKMYRKMEQQYEDLDNEDNRVTKKNWSRKEVEHLLSGQEIYEAYRTASQPEILEGYLSDNQLMMLMEYRRQAMDEKRQKLQNDFQNAWAEDEQSIKRNVVPLVKFRVMGCCRKDLDVKSSFVISMWRPGPEVEELKEGTRYRLYGLTASLSRSKYADNHVQLTASRQTKFQALPLDENILDMVYEPRQLVTADDLRSRVSPFQEEDDLRSRVSPFQEADFVGMVVSVQQAEFGESGKSQDTVYCTDSNKGIIGIKFWGGAKYHNMEDILTAGKILCFCNLMDKAAFRSNILPVLEWSSEYSSCSQTPQGVNQRNRVQEMQGLIQGSGSLKKALEEAKQKLGETLCRKTNHRTPTPEKENATSTATSEKAIQHKLLNQKKMSHLMTYGSPKPLSPVITHLPKSVKKNFVPPKICKKL